MTAAAQSSPCHLKFHMVASDTTVSAMCHLALFYILFTKLFIPLQIYTVHFSYPPAESNT